MTYHVVEKFKAPQGEGRYVGVPMAFIRFQGCSVGKRICTHCDTDFLHLDTWRGGGNFDEHDLLAWVGGYRHVCLTGGEPFDYGYDLQPLIAKLRDFNIHVHIETSGTREYPEEWISAYGVHITVSPKPGWLMSWIERAEEIKVIIGGLGNGDGWPTLEHAIKWADEGKIVYLQPVNKKNEPDKLTLSHALELIDAHPQLRLSVQLHKYIGVR